MLAILPSLRLFVDKIEISTRADPLSRQYCIQPEGRCVLGLQLHGSLAVTQMGELTPLTSSGLTGIQSVARTYVSSEQTQTLLVYFTPWGARGVFKESMKDFSQGHFSLRELVGNQKTEELESQLYENCHNREIIEQVLQGFLLKRCQKVLYVPQPRLMRAVKEIREAKGNICIKELTKQLMISSRQLERDFDEAIGISPKQYASLIRMQSLIEFLSIQPLPLLNWANLAAQFGFYDQSHLIKEFKKVTGLTPHLFLQSIL